MITSKPTAENYSPIYVEDVITSNNNEIIYRIELTVNRPFRWDSYLIKRDCLEEIINMFKLNILDTKKKGKHYLSLGRTGVSDVDTSVKLKYKDYDRLIKSIIEGGHRIKIPFCVYIVLNLLKGKNEDINGKVNISVLYNEYGEKKIDCCGKNEFEYVYNLLNNKTIKEIINLIKDNKKNTNILFSSTKYRKTIFDVITYCYFYFENEIENDSVFKDVPIDELIDLLLHNIYYREEAVSRTDKWQYFDDCNTKGLIVDLTDIVPRKLASDFDGDAKARIMDAFERFYEHANKCEKDKKYISTKSGTTIYEFVLDAVFKMFLLKETKIETFDNVQNIFLSNHEYGIDSAKKKYGFCNSEEKTIEYFDECHKMCDFIYHSMDNNIDLFNTYFLFKKEDSKTQNVLWWYNILPLYVMNKYISDKSIKVYVYDLMCKMKAFQYTYKHVIRGTNVQNYFTSMFNIAKIILRNADNEDKLPSILMDMFSKQWLSKMSKSSLKLAVLRYAYFQDKDEIQRILLWNEYIFIKRLNVSHDNLYRFMTDKNFICDYDHIIPVKQYNKLCNNDNYEADISNVGTLVLLESSLNRSKQDKMDKNSTIYSNSNFYLTSFLLSSTTKGFPKNKIASIDFERYTEEELNNFTIENVSKRNLYLIDTYVDWIYDLTFDFNKDDEDEHNN